MKNLALIIAMSFGFSVSAADCPFSPAESDKIITAISQTGTCEASSALAESCAFGSSIDNAIAGAASSVCEYDFNKKLNKEARAAYNLLITKCNSKYAKMEGTMYISFAAFCRLNVDRLFSNVYTKAQ